MNPSVVGRPKQTPENQPHRPPNGVPPVLGRQGTNQSSFPLGRRPRRGPLAGLPTSSILGPGESGEHAEQQFYWPCEVSKGAEF